MSTVCYLGNLCDKVMAIKKATFDILRYLEDRGIRYWTEGDNISEGWIGIQCIFPACGDPYNHLGVNLDNKRYSCWMCGESGDIISFIRELEGVRFVVAKNIVEQYQEGFKRQRRENRHEKRQYDTVLPKGFMSISNDNVPSIVRHYFETRNLSVDLCVRYNLGYCKHGKYGMRLIVPIYLNDEVVSFQAVDVTGKQDKKYLDCPEDRAIIYNKHLLYGIDGVGEQVILVEGVTDKWAIGRDGVALFGKGYTAEQLVLLKKKAKGKVIKILLDADAEGGAALLYRKLRGQGFKEVMLVELTQGDPAELSREDIEYIIGL